MNDPSGHDTIPVLGPVLASRKQTSCCFARHCLEYCRESDNIRISATLGVTDFARARCRT